MAKRQIDYSETQWKMDKFLPEDIGIQEVYHEIMDNKDEPGLVVFLREYADEARMENYMPKGGTLEGFAKFLIEKEIESSPF